MHFAPDDYAVAVVDSVLARAGLDPDLRAALGDLGQPAETPAAPATVAATASERGEPSSSSWSRRRFKGAAR